MMQLSKQEDGEKAGLPSLAPAAVLGEHMPGDVTEFSPDGALVAIVTNASRTLRYVGLLHMHKYVRTYRHDEPIDKRMAVFIKI